MDRRAETAAAAVPASWGGGDVVAPEELGAAIRPVVADSPFVAGNGAAIQRGRRIQFATTSRRDVDGGSPVWRRELVAGVGSGRSPVVGDLTGGVLLRVELGTGPRLWMEIGRRQAAAGGGWASENSGSGAPVTTPVSDGTETESWAGEWDLTRRSNTLQRELRRPDSRW